MNKVAPKSLSHESAISHVTGAAVFIDDIAYLSCGHALRAGSIQSGCKRKDHQP